MVFINIRSLLAKQGVKMIPLKLSTIPTKLLRGGTTAPSLLNLPLDDAEWPESGLGYLTPRTSAAGDITGAHAEDWEVPRAGLEAVEMRNSFAPVRK
jgi:hypothetical protein